MTYRLSGPLTVDQVGDHAEALRRLVSPDPGENIEVDLEALTEFDILGLQLLFSLRIHCAETGRQLLLRGTENLTRLENMAAFCGLPRLTDSDPP